MSTPLGNKIGNSLEVEEAVEVVAGGGPKDVVDLTIALATEMLRLSGQTDVDVAAALKDGRAMDKWNQMVKAQHGDPEATLPKAKHEHVVLAEESGYLNELDALAVGTASWRLGAGRARKEDPVQFGAGVILHAKRGDQVTKGQPLLTLFTDEENRFDRAIDALAGGIKIESELVAGPELILDRISN
jgi:thymidine phosphorylase